MRVAEDVEVTVGPPVAGPFGNRDGLARPAPRRTPAGSPLGETSQLPAASAVATRQNGEAASHSRSRSCQRAPRLVRHVRQRHSDEVDQLVDTGDLVLRHVVERRLSRVASTWFLAVAGITGDSTVEGHENELEVSAWTWGRSNNALPSGSGAGSGRPGAWRTWSSPSPPRCRGRCSSPVGMCANGTARDRPRGWWVSALVAASRSPFCAYASAAGPGSPRCAQVCR